MTKEELRQQAREKIQDLYCKWCPDECQSLTHKEKLGCLASSGFAEEFESLGYVMLKAGFKKVVGESQG